MLVYTGVSFTSVTASVLCHSAAVIKHSDQKQLRGGKGLFDLTSLRITCLGDGVAHSGRTLLRQLAIKTVPWTCLSNLGNPLIKACPLRSS